MPALGYNQSPETPVWSRRHPEFEEHEWTWNFLYDSYEGGPRYQKAKYGTSTSNGRDSYNLVRHKHEAPPYVGSRDLTDADRIGLDIATRAGEDDFQYRRARTPVPMFVEYAVQTHQSRLFAREIKREGPDKIKKWWKNVDGMGTTIDDWMKSTVAPLLAVLGCLDILLDHPPKPDGQQIVTKSDEVFFGLSDCVATYILPQNMRWWRLDRMGLYAECLVEERDDNGTPFYRHWTATTSTLYAANGEVVQPPVAHTYRRVPIVRVFDKRLPRCRNIGKPRYIGIALYQREAYNRDSELVLSDSSQAHPVLQGPADYLNDEASLPVGPNAILPMLKVTSGAQVYYQEWKFAEPPKSGADSIRQNKNDIIDSVDRAALLTKPAGVAGTGAGTVAQSGISKRLDQSAGNDLLSELAGRFEAAEVTIARWALLVLNNGSTAEAESVEITYPKTFDLATAEELTLTILGFQEIMAGAGLSPIAETEMIQRVARQAVPGLVDKRYREIDDEIAAVVQKQAAAKEKERADAEKARAAMIANPPQPGVPAGGGQPQPGAVKPGGPKAPKKPKPPTPGNKP